MTIIYILLALVTGVFIGVLTIYLAASRSVRIDERRKADRELKTVNFLN